MTQAFRPGISIDAKAPSILVVEDDMLIALYLEDLLVGLGCRVVKAAQVVKGLQLIETQHVDGAFLDVSVFGQPVYPLAGALRMRGIPFAFVTGYEVTHLPVDYRSYPILSKPILEPRIAQIVAGFAQRARSLDEVPAEGARGAVVPQMDING